MTKPENADEGFDSSDCSTSDNRFIHLHECAVSGDMPAEIRILVGRCEINETTFSNDDFSNDDMSLALKFGELVWRRLLRFAEHYERQSKNFMPDDIRGPMMAQAAKDMRFVLSDVARDL
jgi:hypothetical protein